MSTNETLGSVLKEYTDELSGYAEARIQLARLTLIEQSSKVGAGSGILLMLTALFLFVLMFFSIALGYYLGKHFHDLSQGFAIVGGIYLVLFLVIFSARNSISNFLSNKLTGILLQDDETVDGL